MPQINVHVYYTCVERNGKTPGLGRLTPFAILILHTLTDLLLSLPQETCSYRLQPNGESLNPDPSTVSSTPML